MAVLGKKKILLILALNCRFMEMEVRHLRYPFPAATVEFLAHTLRGCPSHPQVASTKFLAESKVPRWSCDVCPFRACLLLACLLLAA